MSTLPPAETIARAPVSSEVTPAVTRVTTVAAPEPPAPALPPPPPGHRRRRVIAALLVVVLVLAAYWASDLVFAYTGDAYVTSDLIAVAPQVTGRIASVAVADDQPVARGALLATIDPQPFRLALAQGLARRTEAAARRAIDRDGIAAAQALLDQAVAGQRLAADELDRARPLAARGDVSQQSLDAATARLQAAQAATADARAALARANKMRDVDSAAVATVDAELATLRWQLDQTRLVAPADGIVTNLSLRVGDQAVANVPLIGLVDTHAWRVVGNFQEGVLRHLRPGRTAWVWLDAYPWHVRRATIRSVARGISREPTAAKLLPYVAPTTDWIRLQRRFPVRITLDDAAAQPQLHMGSDARVLVPY